MENKMIDGVKVAVNYAQASDAPVSATRSRPTSSAPTTSTPTGSWSR